jgi:dihydroorotase
LYTYYYKLIGIKVYLKIDNLLNIKGKFMLLIRNATVLGEFTGGPNTCAQKAHILLDGKTIQKIDFDCQLTAEGAQEIEAEGFTLLPGLVDPQVHFREPGGEHKETLETGSKAAVRGGFTTVITMPNTNPTTDNPAVVKQIINKANEIGLTRILPTASVTKGLAGKELTDYQALKDSGIIALTDDGKGIQDDETMRQAMTQAAKVGLPILDHSEDESLSAKGAIHKGEISEKFGVRGIDSRSESVHVERGCRFSLETGCHFHVLHISTQESIEHVREAKKKGAHVTCEVSPHHLLLCDEDIPERSENDLDPNFKMNPPLRSRLDREACQAALLDGTIDFVATDHAPHSEEEKSQHIHEAPFGIVGLETAFPLMYTHFVKTGKLTLERLVELMSRNAGKIFNIPVGNMNEGAVADLVLMDLNKEIELDKNLFLSKGKNTPFHGWKCAGIPVMTIYEGKIVYQDL